MAIVTMPLTSAPEGSKAGSERRSNMARRKELKT
jgi:hypothetical protein